MPRLAKDKVKLAALSLLLVLLARATVSTYVIRSGFRALSDDDFSRVAIAQAFVIHPSLDPSGTSWLPFPFWLYGTWLSILGASLANARILAFALGLLGAMGIWIAGRWLGLSRNASLLGAIAACTLPYAAWLGVATTPDYFNAVLLLLACCSLARGRLHFRVLGAIALFIATLCRYEAWPVALTWAAWVTIDAARRRHWQSFLLAAFVLSAPLCWMLHGAWHHHDALFFVKRVVTYRRALGMVTDDGLPRLLSAPKHLLLDAPELWTVSLVCAAAALRRKSRPLRTSWLGPSLAMLSVVLFLMIGDWREGSATHHVGRTLLPLWLFATLILAKAIVALAARSTKAMNLSGAIAIVATYSFALLVLRPTFTKLDGFCPRREETELGTLASSRLPVGKRLAICTDDYGYFAVEAAFARPGDAFVLDSHDPRRPAANNVLASAASLRNAMNQLKAEWLVLPTSHESRLSTKARVHFRGSKLLLAELLLSAGPDNGIPKE